MTPNKIFANLPGLVFLIFLLLPLIASQQSLLLTVIAKTLNIIAYLIVSVVLSRVSMKFIFLICVALIMKVFYFAFGNEMYQVIFWICTTILIGSFSAFYYIVDPIRFRSYINVYLLITLPIVVLQALGVFEILHYWNTLFFVCDASLICEYGGEVVNSVGKEFVNIDIKPAQYRPPGLFHSQAILGALLAFGFVLNVYPSINKLSLSLFVCIMIIVFGMSKITQLQLLMISGLLILQYGMTGLSKSVKIISVWLGGLLLYQVLVPGLVIYQLGIDQFIFSIGTRVLDFYSWFMSDDIQTIRENKQTVREITNVGVYIASNPDRGLLSGLYQFSLILPFLILILYKVKRIYSRGNEVAVVLNRILPWSMYLALVLIFSTQLMVTDTFGTQFVMFFWGLLVVPLYCTRKREIQLFRKSYKLRFVL